MHFACGWLVVRVASALFVCAPLGTYYPREAHGCTDIDALEQNVDFGIGIQAVCHDAEACSIVC